MLFLTGFMGSGKSTLGKGLARVIGIPFVDLDSEIERQESMSIPLIFADKGEDSFRKSESRILREIPSRFKSAVVATGGGTPCHNRNMEFMLDSGIVLYLRMSAAAITSRLKGSGKESRPLLASLPEEEIISFVEKKLEERESFYMRANVIADGINATPKKISNLLKENGIL